MIALLRNTLQDIRSLPISLARDRDVLLVIILTLLPWCILIYRTPELSILQQLGGFFCFIAFYWLILHRRPLISVPVYKPRLELAASFGFVVLWILYRVGEYWHWYTPPSFGINACGSDGEVVVVKMVEMVVIPLLFLLMLKYSLPQMGIDWSKSAWLVALIPIAGLIAFGLSNRAIGPFTISSVCYFFGAGLPEEFLFRVFLQTRLEAILKRPLWALWIASFIFGIAHIPIDLHGSFNHWPEAILTAFTFQMSAGIALGYAYLHTRNLLPLSIFHAFIDSAF